MTVNINSDNSRSQTIVEVTVATEYVSKLIQNWHTPAKLFRDPCKIDVAKYGCQLQENMKEICAKMPSDTS
ncbi:hypothetical protein NQ318_014694 [Aromia moschata]|uniref:Uncharacterized protein n=1 Tax=Aromia moschata TaxID=1265417 RepID=A0AAV8ZAQ0_9CUCU|nr:hypothetical protein NQ318_014694 [Aromia moschata]